MTDPCRCGHTESSHRGDCLYCNCTAYQSLAGLRAALRALGCSDGHCIVSGRAAGMHTNGGCHCLGRAEPLDRARVAKALALLRKAAGLE